MASSDLFSKIDRCQGFNNYIECAHNYNKPDLNKYFYLNAKITLDDLKKKSYIHNAHNRYDMD